MPKVIDEEKVLSAAIDVLVDYGYANATTKKIAAAAGMHEATLFRKYGSKLALIEQAIEKKFSTTPLNNLVYTGVLRDDLLAILHAYIETNQLHGAVIPTLLAEISRNPALKKTFVTPWQNIQIILAIIQKHQNAGHIKLEPLLNTVSALIGPIMVAEMFGRANLGTPTPAIDPEEQVDAFLNGRKQ